MANRHGLCLLYCTVLHNGEWEGKHDHRNGSDECMWLKNKGRKKHTLQRVRKTKSAKEGKEMHIWNRMEMISYHTLRDVQGMAV